MVLPPLACTAWTDDASRTHHDGDTIAPADLGGHELRTCTAMAWDREALGPYGTSTEVTVRDCGSPGGGLLVHENGVCDSVVFCLATGILDYGVRRARSIRASHVRFELTPRVPRTWKASPADRQAQNVCRHMS